jgi:hypothetical protein
MTNRLMEDRGRLGAYPVESSIAYDSPKWETLELDHSRFSIFLDRKDNQLRNPTVLIGHHDHGRSAFKVANRSFSYYDLKGVGYVVPDMFSKVSVGKIKPYKGGFGDQRTFGIFDEAEALTEIERITKWKSKGLKTVPYLLVLELHEIRVGVGYPISINIARNEGILNRTDRPVIAVRGWKIPYRLHDLLADDLTTQEYHGIVSFVKDGLFKEGLNFLSDVDYLVWLQDRLTDNLGILHDGGYIHGDLIPHNVTLDGSVIDFDQLKKATKEEIRREKASISKLFSRLEDKVESMTEESSSCPYPLPCTS